MLQLSFEEFQALLIRNAKLTEADNQPEGIYHTSYRSQLDTPVCKGSATNITIREDITLIRNEMIFNETTRVQMQATMPQVGFWHCLKGQVTIYRHNTAPRPDSHLQFQVRSREGFFYVTAASRGWMQFEQGQSVKILVLLFSYPAFKQLVGEQLTALSPGVTNALEEENGYYLKFMKLSSQAMALCEAVFDNPYAGRSRQFYREAKVIELLAYQIDQLSKSAEGQGATGLKLTAEEETRLAYCREVLLASLASPPSLIALAKQIGMSDYRLKNGFRQKYGETPYRFIADQRMFKARQLLLERTLSVSEVAAAVGYTSLGTFSNGFYEKFGIRPSEL
ncbi:MAG TPA: AraC family transcriptional regulator [Cytophagales bacterium]